MLVDDGTAKPTKTSAKRRIVLGSIILACCVILLFRSHARFFSIPTGSMEGTILPGDRILVTDWNYGLRIGGKRFPGTGKPERNDLIVFNFPEGDTVVANFPSLSYYQLVRMCGRNSLVNDGHVIFRSKGRSGSRPTGGILVRAIAERECHASRCIGLPGDTLEMRAGVVFINGAAIPGPALELDPYTFVLRDRFNWRMLKDRFGITASEIQENADTTTLQLTSQDAAVLQRYSNVVSMARENKARGSYGPDDYWPIFPNDARFDRSEDNSGPIRVPARGATISLTASNLPIYQRVISAYEHNDLQVRGDAILINGEPTGSYTFKQDYYWVIGDNRHRSMDSRYWGFVPFDHIVGKIRAVTYSRDPEGGFRWSRFFTALH